MTNKYLISASLRKYAVPAILGAYANYVCSGIDLYFVSSTDSKEAVASLGISSSVLMLTFILSSILTTCGAGMLSAQIAQNNLRKANYIFNNLLQLSIVFPLLLSLICYPFSGAIAYLLGAQTPAFNLLTAEYIRGLILSFMPMVFCNCIISYARVNGSVKISTVAILALILSKILFDWIAIRLDVGLFGIAAGSALSFSIASVVALVHFRDIETPLRITRRLWKRISFRFIPKLVRDGSPAITEYLSGATAIFLLNYIALEVGGTTAVAVLSVIYTLASLTASIAKGISTAAIPFYSAFFTDTDRRSLVDTVRSVFSFTLLLNLFVAFLLCTNIEELAQLFHITDSSQRILFSWGVVLLAISLPLSTINLSLGYYYKSMHQLRLSNAALFVSILLLPVGIAYLFTLRGELVGIWFAYPVGNLLAMAWLLGWVMRKRKEKRQKMSVLERMMNLPDRFYEAPYPHVDFTINNDYEELRYLTFILEAFCKENNVDEKSRYAAVLLTEEICSNIIRFSHSRNRSTFFIDYKLKVLDRSLVMIIRDDGKRFNPLRQKVSAEIDRNLGLKLLRQLSSKVTYISFLGLNNLTIIITRTI